MDKSGWQQTVLKILRSTEGVESFKMDEDGMVKVSGFVVPELLLKKLGKEGKRAKLCWLQYGECSSNLLGPEIRGGGGLGMLSYHQPRVYAPIGYGQGLRYITTPTSSYAPAIGYPGHVTGYEEDQDSRAGVFLNKWSSRSCASLTHCYSLM